MPEFLPVCLADRSNVLNIRISENLTRQMTVSEAAALPLEDFMLLWKVMLPDVCKGQEEVNNSGIPAMLLITKLQMLLCSSPAGCKPSA